MFFQFNITRYFTSIISSNDYANRSN